MRRGSGHLLRFIDLGLLLLLAFLSVAELNPTLQVALPEKTGASQKVIAARVSFDQNWSGTVKQLDNSRNLCQTRGLEELGDCLRSQSSLQYMLAPVQEATVQQVVTLLDLCSTSALQCAIEPVLP